MTSIAILENEMAEADDLLRKGDVEAADALISKLEKKVKAKIADEDDPSGGQPDDEDDWSDTPAARAKRPVAKTGRHKFEAQVDRIADEEQVPKPEAMARARKRFPELHAAYQTHVAMGKTYDEALRDEIAKGCSPECAAQRVAVLYPNAAQDHLAKSAQDPADFLELVDAYRAEHGCDRNVAMSEIRKRYPDAFDQLQRVAVHRGS